MKVPHVVFATAFDQYAVQAFDVNAVDYILNPFDKARISKAIQRARKMLETQTSATDRLEQLVAQLTAASELASANRAGAGKHALRIPRIPPSCW